MRIESEYWITEYVIVKNTSSVRGIYVSQEKFNPNNPGKVLVIYSWKYSDKKMCFPKRSQRKNLFRKLLWLSMNHKYRISSEIKEKYNFKNFSVLRCNVEKVPFSELQRLRTKLDNSSSKDMFDNFFEDYGRG